MIHHVKVLVVQPGEQYSNVLGILCNNCNLTNLDTMVLVLSRAMVKLSYTTEVFREERSLFIFCTF